MELHRSGTPTVAWALGLAACLCNLMLVLLPFGLILGVAALMVSVFGSMRAQSSGIAGMVLSGVSFLIAAIWIGTILSIFAIDPTLL